MDVVTELEKELSKLSIKETMEADHDLETGTITLSTEIFESLQEASVTQHSRSIGKPHLIHKQPRKINSQKMYSINLGTSIVGTECGIGFHEENKNHTVRPEHVTIYIESEGTNQNQSGNASFNSSVSCMSITSNTKCRYPLEAFPPLNSPALVKQVLPRKETISLDRKFTDNKNRLANGTANGSSKNNGNEKHGQAWDTVNQVYCNVETVQDAFKRRKGDVNKFEGVDGQVDREAGGACHSQKHQGKGRRDPKARYLQRRQEIVTAIKTTNKIHLIGCCFVPPSEYQQQLVNGTQIGCTAIARFNNNEMVGKVMTTGTIKGLPNNPYAVIQFATSLIFDDSVYQIHHQKRYSRFCIECNGSTSVFISCEILNNAKTHIFPLVSEKVQDDAIVASVSNTKQQGDFEVEPIALIKLKEIQRTKRSLNLGIEGRNNSCYADTLFFSMFAFENCFNSLLINDGMNDYAIDDNGYNPDSAQNKSMVNILKFKIINPLRRNLRVSWKNMQKLRELFSYYNSNCNGGFMDVEEFAMILFDKILRVPHFLRFRGNYGDYIYQIFVSKDDLTYMPLPNLQTLLEKSFDDQGVALTGMPNPAFIIKLPVSGGRPMFPRLYPDPNIALDKICTGCNDMDRMDLRAVICLRGGHFTCFLRVKDVLKNNIAEEGYTRFYHDSMPSQNRPRLTEITGFEEWYCRSVPGDYATESGNQSRWTILDDWMEWLLTSAYMCIYVPNSV